MILKKLFYFSFIGIVFLSCGEKKTEKQRPNILFCIADDWGWPHAGVYGDEVVKTPAFDRLAAEGVLFDNAFVSSPSCTPSRGAVLTGQHFWRLEEGANLWSTLDRKIPVYPLLLQQAGYFVGSWRKSWGPGNLKAGGYDTLLPAGKKYPKGFEQFLSARPEGSPFCFWLGASDPHRPYDKGSGAASGIPVDNIQVPGFYPDVEEIRSDIADYYAEVNRFDADVARAIFLLDSIGELDNTIIVVTGDHGMPFPRCKGNLYDMGVKVPLVVRWGGAQKARVSDFVSLTDLAPTFLQMAGVEVPEQMTGRSLVPFLQAGQSQPKQDRSYAVFGRERHTPAQLAPSMDGYPSRAIRTEEYLYIRNFHPERWPAGVPAGATHPMNAFSDSDNGPTKTFLLENKEQYGQYFDWNFGKRPAEELYQIADDPYQLTNLAQDENYSSVKEKLSTQLINVLVETKDPRLVDSGIDFDDYPYRAGYKLKKAKK